MTPYSSPNKSLFSFIDIDGTDRNTSHQSSTKKPMYSQHVQNKVLFVSSYIAKNKELTIKGRSALFSNPTREAMPNDVVRCIFIIVTTLLAAAILSYYRRRALCALSKNEHKNT
eukprot:scaffold15828_cov200-Alexandrium_tamarense.AAC.5